MKTERRKMSLAIQEATFIYLLFSKNITQKDRRELIEMRNKELRWNRKHN